MAGRDAGGASAREAGRSGRRGAFAGFLTGLLLGGAALAVLSLAVPGRGPAVPDGSRAEAPSAASGVSRGEAPAASAPPAMPPVAATPVPVSPSSVTSPPVAPP